MAKKTKRSTSTRKVQVGYDTYMNTKTGEVVEMPKFVIQGGDINFEKAWIWHICDAYKLVGNKSVLVLNYLVSGRDQNNIIIANYEEMAAELKIGTATVARTMRKLKENDIISMPTRGVYRLNPEMMWKGSHCSRMQVLYEYRQEKASEEPPTREERIQALADRSELLMREVAKVQREMEQLIDGANEELETAAAE